MFRKFLFPLLLLMIRGDSKIVHGHTTSTLENGESPSLTPISRLAKFVMANMNNTVSPCDDFYTHACGNWQHTKVLPAEDNYFPFKKLWESQVDILIEKFLNGSTQFDHTNDSIAETKAKQFYSSCRNLGNFSKISTISIAMEKFFNSINRTSTDWIELNNLFAPFDVYPFLKLKISKNQIILKYPENGWFGKIKPTFRHMMPGKLKEFDEKIHELNAFHRRLEDLSENNDEPKEAGTIDEFLEDHKQDALNWTHLIDLAFNGTGNHSVKIYDYLKNFNHIDSFLRSVEDKEILLLYTVSNFISVYSKMFSNEMAVYPLHTFCLHETKRYFQSALIPRLIEKIGNNEIEAWHKDIHKIIEQLKSAFSLRIEKTNWMDESMKSIFKSKIQSLTAVIGFVDEMKSYQSLDLEFENVDITENFWLNLLNLKRKEVSDTRTSNDAIPKLAFAYPHYFAERNLISIPMQYSQMPFYNSNFTNLIKLNGIGFLVGYELAHALNSKNFKYNSEGIEGTNRWSNELLKNLSGHFSCLESKLHNLQLNAYPSLDEFIADNVGARIAYDAFLKQFEVEQSLDDVKPLHEMDLTQKQFHFLHFTQNLCTGTISNDFHRNSVHRSDEEPSSRVNRILRNMPEFSEVYQCPLGSNMNPDMVKWYQCL